MSRQQIDEDLEVIVRERVLPTSTVTLADILARVWVRKYIFLIWIVIGAAIGVLIAQGTPKTYQSSLQMVPEALKGNTTSAALAALGMSSEPATEDAYAPTLYPDIVESIPFIVSLLDVEVQTTASDTTYTLRDYIEFHTQEPWWSSLLGKLSKQDIGELRKSRNEMIDPFRLTKAESDLCNMVASSIRTDVDKRTAEVNITVTMQDPLVAAQLTDTVAARLQEYIIDYRTAKARSDLDYAIVINEEAQRQYYEAQQAYAEYMDRNQGLALYSAQTTRDRLENEMQLAFNLYNQTSAQVQQAEAKVQESTPAFAVVEPSTVAIKPVAPRKMVLVCGWTIAFAFLGIIFISIPLFISGRFENRVRQQEEIVRREREEAATKPRWWQRIFKRNSKDYNAEIDSDDEECIEEHVEGGAEESESSGEIYYNEDQSRYAPRPDEEVSEDDESKSV